MITPADINVMIERTWPTSGVSCVAVSGTSATGMLMVAERDVRPGGFLSGPARFAIADATLWFMVPGALGRVEPIAMTSALSMRFLRPAMGGRLYARAQLERAGAKSTVGTIRAWVDGAEERPTATAQGTCFLPETRSGI